GRHPTSIEFTSPEEDAKRRDFTINGMFYDPFGKKVIDFVEGRKDLESRVLRAIGDADARFSEDYLRMIRAVRFAARLGFKIEEKTWNSIRSNMHNAANLAVERVREELSICLLEKNPDNALQLMLDSGMMEVLLPEVAKMKGINQPEQFHPEGDVFEHTKLMLRQMAQDTEGLRHGKIIKGAIETTETLVWAVLLHDVGKPETITIADRIRFDRHASVGAEISDKICARLKFSNEMRENIVNLVQNHMKFIEMKKMKLSTLKKFLQRDNFNEHLALHRLDCLASHGDLSNIDYINDKIAELSAEEIKPAPILTGTDIIELGVKRGPLIGEILSDLEIQQLDGLIKSRIEAINFVKERYINDK
ncbi:MAG: HD domain-containing protein, partial [Planctomycetes bacterium]|nr:HD domain-containing protein [Planctomycetota bacterium]